MGVGLGEARRVQVCLQRVMRSKQPTTQLVRRSRRSAPILPQNVLRLLQPRGCLRGRQAAGCSLAARKGAQLEHGTR